MFKINRHIKIPAEPFINLKEMLYEESKSKKYWNKAYDDWINSFHNDTTTKDITDRF